jgi:hypothetical protein
MHSDRRQEGVAADVIWMTGHRDDFSRQLHHPELMQDICAVESQRERLSDWNMNLVGDDGARVRVARLPPPDLFLPRFRVTRVRVSKRKGGRRSPSS